MQLPLLADVARTERPWKRTTGTSKTAIRHFEANGKRVLRAKEVLLAIRAIWNRKQQSPTADEIAAYLHRKGVIPDAHPDRVKPRLSELLHGKTVYTKKDGAVIGTRHEGGGLVEKVSKRKSSWSGENVWTWRAREMGSVEPR